MGMGNSMTLVFVTPPPATDRRRMRRKAKTGHLATGTILKSGMIDWLPLFPPLYNRLAKDEKQTDLRDAEPLSSRVAGSLNRTA